MKTLWLFCMRAYLRIGLFFYFKSIKVYGLENMPKHKAVLILCNHQNALLDPLIIATRLNNFAYFLTRAGVFKKEFIAKFLKAFNMIPVYRIRDGWSNITNNNSIFKTVTKLLNQNNTIVIFPEGNHNLARRVRPLSKGFTRIVFDTLENFPDTDLQIVPMGLNFINAEKFADSVALFVGKPINAKDYVFENRNEGIVKLKQVVSNSISELTTNIPLENYDETLKQLESLNVDFLKPIAVNKCIETNFETCEEKPKSKLNWLRSFFKCLLILNLLLPYLVWKFSAQPKIKEVEFIATFRFAIALTLVPIYLIFIGLILASFFGFKVALLYVLFMLILDLLAVKL